jgi:hypothetical protein
MATQEMILKLLFNDDGTFAGLEEINKELKKVDDSTTKVEESTKTLKQQYAELKKQQDKFDPGTKKFQELSVQMGELKDRMNDAAEAVKGNTGPAIEGARASFGMMGEQMMNLDFEGLSQSLNLVSGNLARLKPEDIGKGLKSMAEAGINGLKALGKAVLANPLLAVAGIITAIIVNFEKWIHLFPSLENALTGIDEQQRNVAKNAQATADASKKAYDNSALQENSLRLQGKSEKEILQIKMKKLETSIQDAKVNLEIQEKQAESQIAASRRNAKLLQDIIKAGLEAGALSLRLLAAPIDLVLATANKVSEALGLGSIITLNLNDEISKLTEAGSKMAASLFIDPAEQEAELKASFEKQRDGIAQMTSDYQGMQLSIKKIDADAAQDKKEKLQKEIDEYEKAQQEITDLLAKWDEERLAEEAKTDDERRKAYQDRRDAEIKAEDEKFKSLNAIQESAKEKEITTAIEASEALYALAGEDAAAEALIAENLAKQILDINKKYADAELKLEEEKEKKKQELRMANIQQGFEMANLALGALMDLNNAAAKGDEASQRKAFNRNKLMQKAQATIAMAAGIVQQLAVPQDQLTGMNFVKAAAIAAAGIANIVKINQTQFGGGGGGGAGANLNAPTGGGANAPALDFSGPNMQTNAPGTVETYVLAGNVANALEARQKIIDQSHL